MQEILPETPHESSLFLQKTCYYFQYTANYYDLYAFLLPNNIKTNSLNTLQRTVMLKTYLALYQQSLKSRPQMAKEYHLATVKLAAQIIGGKR